MSQPMYHMLSTSPFHLPTNPGPQVVYYGARVPILDTSGNSVNDADGNPMHVPIPALNCATQAMIEAELLALEQKHQESMLQHAR